MRADSSRDAFPHSIDVVIPTHNRAALLRRTLESLSLLRVPTSVRVELYVVGNACLDDTESVVHHLKDSIPFPTTWMEEPRAGKAHALNSGVAAGSGAWLVFFDDDVYVETDWLETFLDALRERDFDFCAGRYDPDFEVAPPDWLPPRRCHHVLSYHRDTPAEQITGGARFAGGNCAVRRRVFQELGGYDPTYTRQAGRRGLGVEDSDFALRMVGAGYTGWYLPELRVRHWIPAARMTKAYFRMHAFWMAYSWAHMELKRESGHGQVPSWFGIHRWRVRGWLQSAAQFLAARCSRRDESEILDRELDIRAAAGGILACWDARSGRGHWR